MRTEAPLAHGRPMDTTTTTSTVPAEVVAGIYAAFGRDDMPGLLARLHPQVDWSAEVTAPGAELVPMLRQGVGRAAVERYFDGGAQLAFHTFEVGRVLVDGDAVVVVEIHLVASHRTTQKTATIDELHHWIVRDGLVVRYRPYVNTAALIERYKP